MLTIVDYRAGNIRSVQRACEAVEAPAVISQDPEAIATAEKIIFPGVGAAHSAMPTLRKTGIDQALKKAYGKGTPILGICLGTQIILDSSEEGNEACLGLVPGKTVKFDLPSSQYKIPHMGWNTITINSNHPILEDIPDQTYFYFVHSYYPVPQHAENIVATTNYGSEFCSIIQNKNLVATQFHLEKSGRFGLQLLKNFVHWNPS